MCVHLCEKKTQVCPICRHSNPIPTWGPTYGSNVHKVGNVRARYHRSCIQGWLMHLAKLGEEKMKDPCTKLQINACLRDLFPPKHSFWMTWLSARQRRKQSSSGMPPRKRAKMKDASGPTVTTCKYSCRLASPISNNPITLTHKCSKSHPTYKTGIVTLNLWVRPTREKQIECMSAAVRKTRPTRLLPRLQPQLILLQTLCPRAQNVDINLDSVASMMNA